MICGILRRQFPLSSQRHIHHHRGTLDLDKGKDGSAIPLSSICAEFRNARAIGAVEVSGEDENPVGAMAAESKSGARKEMNLFRLHAFGPGCTESRTQ